MLMLISSFHRLAAKINDSPFFSLLKRPPKGGWGYPPMMPSLDEIINLRKVFKMNMNQMNTIESGSLPMLIGIKDALRMGITRNGFYTISHKHKEMVVAIGDRLFLQRDALLAWIEQGGDRKEKQKG